ncbi:MAG: FAD-dependent monooxygenase [Terracidiphilus sp.]
MSDTLRSVDNLVIGGGLAGAMAAIELGRAGRSVTLLERERGPHHKVCGEFLSAEAVEYLERAGVSPVALGAEPIRMVRLCAGRRATEAELPFTAFSLSRYVLDEAMLREAVECGCTLIRGVCAEQLANDRGESIAKLSDGSSIHAQTVVLATGKHDLRGWRREGGRQTDLVGFKMHWRLTAAQTRELREAMELFLFRGGYGGISLVEHDVANLCFVVQRRTLRRMGGFEEALDSATAQIPQLKMRLAGAELLWERPLAISPIPYGHLGSANDGLWRVGDQFAVIPSFTGDGMAIALHSGALAAQMILRGERVEAFNARLDGQLQRGMNLALWLSRAMVSGAGRALAVRAMRMRPNAMRWIAERTRVPKSALTGPEFIAVRPHCA